MCRCVQIPLLAHEDLQEMSEAHLIFDGEHYSNNRVGLCCKQDVNTLHKHTQTKQKLSNPCKYVLETFSRRL